MLRICWIKGGLEPLISDVTNLSYSVGWARFLIEVPKYIFSSIFENQTPGLYTVVPSNSTPPPPTPILRLPSILIAYSLYCIFSR